MSLTNGIMTSPHSDTIHAYCCLLGCDIELSVRSIPTFQRDFLPYSDNDNNDHDLLL
jgi:hypothetical protein